MRHVKRIVQGILVGGLLALGPLTLAADRAWVPLPLPATLSTAGEVPVLLLALDCSWPLAQGPVLRARVRTAATVALETVPLGTYVVVVGFGTRARVVADRFVLTPYDRESLRQQAVDRLAMDDVKTDLAALESLLSEVQGGLVAAFGRRGFLLETQVLSDGRPDPVDPRDTRTFDVLLGQPTTRVPLGGGVFAYTLRIRQGPALASDNASQPAAEVSPMPEELPPAEPALPALAPEPIAPSAIVRTDDAIAPEPPSTAEPAVQGMHTEGTVHDRGIPWGWVVGSLVSIVVLGGYGVMHIRQWQWQGRMIVEDTTRVETGHEHPPQPHPVTLVVTEYTRTPDGERHCVQGPKALPYASGMALAVGADPGRCAWVLRTPGAPAQLALWQFASERDVTLTPRSADVQLDGQLVEGPTPLGLDVPHILRAGAVELRFALTRQRPEANDLGLPLPEHDAQPTTQPAMAPAEPSAVA
jgi:hypothetical protein